MVFKNIKKRLIIRGASMLDVIVFVAALIFILAACTTGK